MLDSIYLYLTPSASLFTSSPLTEVFPHLPCSMAARTLRFSSVGAAKLTARSRGGTAASVRVINGGGEAETAAPLPGCRFEELFPTRVLDAELDDEVAELLVTGILVRAHHSAGRRRLQ